MKNLITCEQFSKEELDEIFSLTDEIIKNPSKFSNKLKDKIISVLFYEPSTRTRLSFEAAALKLGAKVIGSENASDNSSTRKGETLKDTIKVLSGYCDAAIIRHPDKNAFDDVKDTAQIPLINAGTSSYEHPTQALLDLYTIRQSVKKIDGIKIAILGDLLYSRTIHSLIKLLVLFKNIKVYALSKDEFSLKENYIKLLTRNNIEYTKCNGFDAIPEDVDVLYHTRIQTERFSGNFSKEQFVINKEVLNKFSENTFVMHPLPRNNEISEDVDNDSRSIFFKQAHNGLFVRMAILISCLK